MTSTTRDPNPCEAIVRLKRGPLATMDKVCICVYLIVLNCLNLVSSKYILVWKNTKTLYKLQSEKCHALVNNIKGIKDFLEITDLRIKLLRTAPLNNEGGNQKNKKHYGIDQVTIKGRFVFIIFIWKKLNYKKCCNLKKNLIS